MLKFLYSSLFLLTFCTSKTESLPASNKFLAAQTKLADFKILVYAESESQEVNTFIQRNNIQKVGFVGDTQFLDPNKKFAFSSAMMDQELQRAFPNKNEVGIAYIDLEAPYIEFLKDADSHSEEFKKSKKLFLDVLEYAQKARPNVKWGFYGIPFTSYWTKTESFYNKDNRIAEILNKSDVLFPSIYIFYNKMNFILENESFIKVNAEQMIRIGQKYHKPVYPLIMSRYHPSSKTLGYESLSETDFRFYVSTLKNTNYHGKYLDGIMYWNADRYFYKTKENKVVQEVQQSRMPFNSYYDNYLINNLSILIEAK